MQVNADQWSDKSFSCNCLYKLVVVKNKLILNENVRVFYVSSVENVKFLVEFIFLCWLLQNPTEIFRTESFVYVIIKSSEIF